MRKFPHLFFTTLTALSLTVACSSPAQTPPDDGLEGAFEGQDGDIIPVVQNADGARRITVITAPDPAFIKVSKELREAVGSIGQAPPSQSIELLRSLRKNLFIGAHDKQLAAYLLAGLVRTQSSPDSLKESFKLYEEAAANEHLATPARIHAADVAASANDEKQLQEVLMPLLKKADAIVRAEKEKAKTQGETQALFQRIQKQDPALAEPIYRLGESFYRNKDMASATNVFARVRDYYPDTEYATGCSYYLGSIALETQNDWTTALKEFRHYLKVCPEGRNSLKIVSLMVAAANPQAPPAPEVSSAPAAITLTPDDRALIAMALYKHQRYDDALATWNQLPNPHIYKSVCLMKTGKRQEGVNLFLSMVSADPKNALIPDVASAFCKPVSTKEALALWQEILKRNPAKLDVALWNVAKRLGAPQGAPYYARLIAERPTSEFAPESAWWLVWSEIKQAYSAGGADRKTHFTRALGHCDHALKKYSHTHIGPKFAFWKGKLHEALGQKALAVSAYEHAERNYPGSYYGYRSKFRGRHLGSQDAGKTIIPDRKWSFVPGRSNPDPGWTWPEPPALFQWAKAPHWLGETSAILLWLRQYDECFKHARGKVPQEIKAWVLLKQGQILKANANASVNLEGYPHSTPRWHFAYPLAYGNIIEREAKKRGLDPLLIHGLIRQESRYDHNAVSRSNARGLMQLLEGTAFGVAKHNGIPLSSKQELFDPETNIQLGTAYVAYVLKRAEGNAMLAVASYNGGPNAVAKWLKQHQAAGISDMDVYVENIPYDETRDYVRKVFAHYWNYEHLYL